MKTKKQKTQVVIIGAGPTGLMMAAQLLRYGIDFIIIDKKPGVTKLSKALVLHARSLEILDQIDLANDAVSLGAVTSQVKIMVGGKPRGKCDFSGMGEGMSKFPFVLILEQMKTEELLYAHIKNHQHEVVWNTELKQFRHDKYGVCVTVSNEDTTYEIEAEYMIGCDGGHSVVRKQLDIPFLGSTCPKHFYVADVCIDWNLPYHKNMYMCLSKKSFTLFFRMKKEKQFRVVGMLPEHVLPKKNIPFHTIAQHIGQHAQFPFSILEHSWHSTYKVHTRMAQAFAKGRCFLVGDSAHVHTPAGGQGMNTGIQDAYNLAWKLAFVLKKHQDTSILKSYSVERMHNAKNLLNTTDTLFSLLARPSGILLQIFRLYIFPRMAWFLFDIPFVKKHIFPFLSQTGISYKKCKSVTKATHGKIHNGDRVPYFITGKNKCIHDYLKEPQYHLISFGSLPYKKSMDTQVFSFPVKHVHFTEAPKNIVSSSANFSLLVRPDGHIQEIFK